MVPEGSFAAFAKNTHPSNGNHGRGEWRGGQPPQAQAQTAPPPPPHPSASSSSSYRGREAGHHPSHHRHDAHHPPRHTLLPWRQTATGRHTAPTPKPVVLPSLRRGPSAGTAAGTGTGVGTGAKIGLGTTMRANVGTDVGMPLALPSLERETATTTATSIQTLPGYGEVGLSPSTSGLSEGGADREKRLVVEQAVEEKLREMNLSHPWVDDQGDMDFSRNPFADDKANTAPSKQQQQKQQEDEAVSSTLSFDQAKQSLTNQKTDGPSITQSQPPSSTQQNDTPSIYSMQDARSTLPSAPLAPPTPPQILHHPPRNQMQNDHTDYHPHHQDPENPQEHQEECCYMTVRMDRDAPAIKIDLCRWFDTRP